MQTGHQAIARPGAKARANIHSGSDSVQHNRSYQQRTARHHRLQRRQDGQRGVRRQSQHDDIAHRTEPRHLPDRDPQQQYRRAGQDNHRTETDTQLFSHPEMENIPRIGAEIGMHEERR